MAPPVDEMQVRIDELDARMEKLRGQYDMYFLGLERTPPTMMHTEVEKRLHDVRTKQPRSSVLRFRVQGLVQRWTSYTSYWQRIIRQIEEGTYKRDVAKARRALERDKAKAAAKDKQDEQQAYALDEDDDFDPGALLGLEEVNTNAFDTERPAPPPQAAEPAFPPVPRAAPTGFSAPTPPAYSAPTPPSYPRPASQPGRPATARMPATTPANGAPMAPPPSVASGAAGAGALPPQRIALPPVHTPRTAPLVGSARASVPPPALASAPPAAPATASQSGFALPPVHTARVAPVVPPQRAPATASQPGFALPPVHTARVAPVAPGSPSTGRFPAVTPPAAARPAPTPAAAPAAASNSGDDPALRALHQRYRETRKSNGEGDVSYDTLARQVRDTLPKLAQKYPGHEVSLDVTVKDGKTILRPVVKAKK